MNDENILYEKLNTESESEKNKAKGAIMCLLIAVFIFLTAGLGIISFAAKDKAFSPSENRVLAQLPKLTLSSLTDGSFMENFESWLADQFPLRDNAIRLKTEFDRITGKREENGVYIGEKDFLFDSQSAYDENKIAEKTALIDDFLQKHPDTEQMIAIIPNSSYIYSEHLPYNIKLSDQYSQIKAIYGKLNSESLIKLDATDILLKLKEKNVQLYYKTDHHWTTRSAYEVYSHIEKHWQLQDSDVKYDFYTVTDDFEGTLASTAGVHEKKDSVEVCIPQGSDGTYIVSYDSQQRKTSTLFSEEKLNEKNKYEVFLGGNFDIISIETAAENESSLLIVKDSYANCIIPMLTPHFSEIVVIDPRYMTESIDAVMSEYNFTHILFLYNLNTFLEDSALNDAL